MHLFSAMNADLLPVLTPLVQSLAATRPTDPLRFLASELRRK